MAVGSRIFAVAKYGTSQFAKLGNFLAQTALWRLRGEHRVQIGRRNTMKTLLATAAALALLSGPAFAQSEGIDPQTTEPMEQQMVPEVAPEETVGLADVTFIGEQGAEQKLASEWIGKTVYGFDDESIGDINDLLFAEDGSLQGIVLGVGGFLGIGEKAVAVPFEVVQTETDPDSGDTVLYLPVMAAQLESAPDFTTLADIRALEEAKRIEENQGLGMSPGVEPAPVQ
jgi:sporulation protein YlmC with PRC-barrel domain